MTDATIKSMSQSTEQTPSSPQPPKPQQPPPQLPDPIVPHEYVEKGIGTGKVEKR